MSSIVALIATLPLAGPGSLTPVPGEDPRYVAALQQFEAARDRRDANAAGRALAVLDELEPGHPSTLRSRAELAELREDPAARERALRDWIRVEPASADAANSLVDTLLELRQPADALQVARKLAPQRLRDDQVLQGLEREWVPHFEAGLQWRQREGEASHDRLDGAQLQLAMVASHADWGRIRISVDSHRLETATLPAGLPYGTRVSLPTALEREESGTGVMLHWAPRPRLVIEFGHSPSGFAVDNFLGGLRLRVGPEAAPFTFGIQRDAVTDSLLAYAGARDPASGRLWGGVVRNRAYVEGQVFEEGFGIYGSLTGAYIEGRQVEDNEQWGAGVGFWKRMAGGNGWQTHVGGNLTAIGSAHNLSHHTLGHGGYFSPRRFLSIGPTFDIEGRLDGAIFRFEGGVNWQVLREESSDYFPTDPALQAASGDLRYPSDAREGVGARIAASVEWRLSGSAVAGLRLEGVRGEAWDEVRLQVYARRWDAPVTAPVRGPPLAVLPPDFGGFH